ncbi:unnamed protein product [Malus baccata var. baccata]
MCSKRSCMLFADIKGAGRLYKDEKPVKQWIFSSFTNVKVKEVPHCEGSSIFPHYHIKTSGIPILLQFAMRTTEDQWSISTALGNIQNVLVQQGLLKVLQGLEALPKDWSDKEKEDDLDQAHSVIMLSLSNEVLHEMDDETTTAGLRLKLESIYMTKFLTKWLFLKQCLYTLRYT